jgi:hypothetical protein
MVTSNTFTSMSLSKERCSTIRVFAFAASSFETHEQQRVERIDWSHQQRLAVPIARLFRERTKLVVTPRVLFVGFPRMEKLGAYLRRHGGTIDRRRGEHRRRGENKDDCGDA